MPKALQKTIDVTCPTCYATSNQRCIESNLRRDGIRRRRIECKECKHRYTSFDQPLPLNSSGKRSLDDNSVWLILASDKRNFELAKEYNVSDNVISNIRSGSHYTEIYKKFHGLTTEDLNGCTRCYFWENKCTFGFPEAGGTFASECTLFQSKQ